MVAYYLESSALVKRYVVETGRLGCVASLRPRLETLYSLLR